MTDITETIKTTETTETKHHSKPIYGIDEYYTAGSDKIHLVISNGIDMKHFMITNKDWIKEPIQMRHYRLARTLCMVHNVDIAKSASASTDDSDDSDYEGDTKMDTSSELRSMPVCECENLMHQFTAETKEAQQAHGINLVNEYKLRFNKNDSIPNYPVGEKVKETKEQLANPVLDIDVYEPPFENFEDWDGAVMHNIPTLVHRKGGNQLDLNRSWIRIKKVSDVNKLYSRSQNGASFYGTSYMGLTYGMDYSNCLGREGSPVVCHECENKSEFIRLFNASSNEEAQEIWDEFNRPNCVKFKHFHD
jgi:hypothetical protein